MLRALFGSALLLLAACKDDEAAKADAKAAAEAPATPSSDAKSEGDTKADDEPDTGESTKSKKKRKGLTGAIGDVVGGIEPSKHTLLIPEGATFVAGVDIAAFAADPLLPVLQAQLGSRQQEQLRASMACGVGFPEGKTFVIGVDVTSRNMAMVVEAKGLGTRKVLECMAREIGNFTLSDDAKTLSDHTGGGIVLNDDAVAFASPAWMEPLRERIAGKGKAAVQGSLRGPLARTKPSQALWFAGEVPVSMQAMASGMLGAKPSVMAAHAKLGQRVAIEFVVEVPDPSATQRSLQEKWNAMRSFAVASGLPRTISDTVAIDNDDEVVRLQLEATASDIEELFRVAKGSGAPF